MGEPGTRVLMTTSSGRRWVVRSSAANWSGKAVSGGPSPQKTHVAGRGPLTSFRIVANPLNQGPNRRFGLVARRLNRGQRACMYRHRAIGGAVIIWRHDVFLFT